MNTQSCCIVGSRDPYCQSTCLSMCLCVWLSVCRQLWC